MSKSIQLVYTYLQISGEPEIIRGNITTDPTFSLESAWVLPMEGPPLSRARITVSGSRIESLTGGSSPNPPLTLVIPGLINLHSHLDYSALTNLNPDSDSDSALLPWIERLVQASRQFSRDDFRASALEGASRAALSGTTFIADSSYSGASAHALARTGLKGIVGLELFGLDESHAEKTFSAWQDRLDTLESDPDSDLEEALGEGRVSLTVSPHAPYTVSPALWRLADRWAEKRNMPVLAHLSESQEECDWLAGACEELDLFLMSVLPGDEKEKENLLASIAWKGKGLSPVEHLAEHGLINHRLLAAHLTRASRKDIDTLALNGAAAAHCPRSNLRLGNGRAPLQAMREAGLKVGLGTDSLASCDSLSLLDEARFALRLHGQAGTSGVLSYLELATIEAARALAIDAETGSLVPGKAADLCVIDLPGNLAAPGEIPELTAVLDYLGAAPVAVGQVYVNGRIIVDSGRPVWLDRAI
ncbi:MAG: amidohydrolase family protein [Candidatus Obscuribacterales bacterium]